MQKPQTALITGATDGIGKALALKLLRQGWEVIIIGRSPDKCVATVTELKQLSGQDHITAIEADLSLLQQTDEACERFLATHSSLDLLVLNANAIANEYTITSEGHEQNFALGYLSRVLMIWKLEKILAKTPNSQVLSVIGMDTQRLDFEDLKIEKNFTGRKGLTRWQWAINLFTKNYADKSPFLVNLYMPGLVKTKILANEPQPMRAFVQLMNLIIGLPTDKAAENIFKVVRDIVENLKTGRLYSWSKERAHLKLEVQNGDWERLEALNKQLLNPYF